MKISRHSENGFIDYIHFIVTFFLVSNNKKICKINRNQGKTQSFV